MRYFSIVVLAKLDEGNKVHLYDNNGQGWSLVQIQMHAFLGHNSQPVLDRVQFLRLAKANEVLL